MEVHLNGPTMMFLVHPHVITTTAALSMNMSNCIKIGAHITSCVGKIVCSVKYSVSLLKVHPTFTQNTREFCVTITLCIVY